MILYSCFFGLWFSLTYPQHAQLIAHIGRRKGNGRRARHIRTLQFRDQIVNGQRVDLLVLRERGNGVPAKVPDERDTGGIVRRFRCNGAIEVRKFDAVAQRRRRGAERDLCCCCWVCWRYRDENRRKDFSKCKKLVQHKVVAFKKKQHSKRRLQPLHNANVHTKWMMCWST